MRLLACAVALIVAIGAAQEAQASRAPTDAEASAIRAAVERFAARPGPPAPRAKVTRVRVSTVNGRYAIAKVRTGGPAKATAILARNGQGRWRVVTYGTAGFPFKGVPRAVLNDLLGATICDCARVVSR